MAEHALELTDIRKTYGVTVKTEVLHGINLTFERQSFNAIIGQSGSGKSTLLNIIGTLDAPSEGHVSILGRRADKLSKKQLAALRNETIGFIFQHHYLLPEFTALENILMPRRIRDGKADADARQYAQEIIEFIGLEDVQHNKAMDMSGGQQQRVAIARALINRPEIILADEPTGALDTDTTDKIYNLLRDINKRFHTTFIVITHDRKVAEKADRIVELKDGNVELDVRPRS